MFLEKALQAIGIAALHPLAVGMYVLVVASWLIISWRVKRHRTLMEHLKTLPAKDRLKALELEIGPLPKKSLNAEQWLRAREQSFNLARWGIVSLTAIIVLSLAVFYYLHAAPKAMVIAGHVTLDDQPLANATLILVGVAGEWRTDHNGAFHFQIPVPDNADSLTLSVLYEVANEPMRRDTTVSRNAAAALQLHWKSSPLYIAGWVKEEGTGKPITGAQIILAAERGHDSTNAQGYFRFIARGKAFEALEATITHPDYPTQMFGLTLSETNQISLRRKP